jgi:hypothetical protein
VARLLVKNLVFSMPLDVRILVVTQALSLRQDCKYTLVNHQRVLGF